MLVKFCIGICNKMTESENSHSPLPWRFMAVSGRGFCKKLPWLLNYCNFFLGKSKLFWRGITLSDPYATPVSKLGVESKENSLRSIRINALMCKISFVSFSSNKCGRCWREWSLSWPEPPRLSSKPKVSEISKSFIQDVIGVFLMCWYRLSLQTQTISDECLKKCAKPRRFLNLLFQGQVASWVIFMTLPFLYSVMSIPSLT